MEALERLAACGVVPVVVLENAADAVPTAKAMLAGGIDTMEITFRTAAAADSIRAVAAEVPDMFVGAGTVITLEQAKLAVECGAKFIVAPGFNEEVVAWCVENNIPVTPGCVTPTEIMMGMKAGLKVVKFFPANVYGGQKAIKALGGPFTTKALSGGGTLIDWGVHRIDQILYMTGDPDPISVSAATFCKLGRDIPAYEYKGMWSAATADMNGTYDVDDSVTALVRTTGPVITLNGAWAQNVDEPEQYVDFMGTKAGIRLSYCGGYKLYSVKNGEFVKEFHDVPGDDMFKSEIADFLDCIETGKASRAHIDNAVRTSLIMQGAYDSSEQGKEIVF